MSFDASIPVLTEVLQADEAPASILVPAAPGALAEVVTYAASASTAPDHDDGAADALAWTALERRLNEQILQQLQGSLDAALDQRLAEALRQALGGVAAQLRESLQPTLEKAVAAAVGLALREQRDVTPE
jgi:hypothetical protein